MEWSVKTYDTDEVIVLANGIWITIEMYQCDNAPAFYVATLGGAKLGRFPTRELAKQHLLTAGKAELENAIRSLAELAPSPQKQVWR